MYTSKMSLSQEAGLTVVVENTSAKVFRYHCPYLVPYGGPVPCLHSCLVPPTSQAWVAHTLPQGGRIKPPFQTPMSTLTVFAGGTLMVPPIFCIRRV